MSKITEEESGYPSGDNGPPFTHAPLQQQPFQQQMERAVIHPFTVGGPFVYPAGDDAHAVPHTSEIHNTRDTHLAKPPRQRGDGPSR